MNNCETCKWWRRDKKWGQGDGSVSAYCDHPTITSAYITVYEDSKPIGTRPNFGCVLHEDLCQKQQSTVT